MANDRATASIVYRPADALVRFRYYAELNYAQAPEPYASSGDAPPVPPIIERCFGEIIAAATRLTKTLAVPEAAVLIPAARSIHQQYRDAWLNAVHRTQLAERKADAEATESVNPSERDWLIVLNSPFAPPTTSAGIGRTCGQPTMLHFEI